MFTVATYPSRQEWRSDQTQWDRQSVYQNSFVEQIWLQFLWHSKSCSTLPTMKIVKFEFNPSFRGVRPNGPGWPLSLRQILIIFVTAFFIIVLSVPLKFTASVFTFWWVLAFIGRQRDRRLPLLYTKNFLPYKPKEEVMTSIYYLFFMHFLNFIQQICTNCVCSGYYNNYLLPSLTICPSNVFEYHRHAILYSPFCRWFIQSYSEPSAKLICRSAAIC